jgi:hypothetical protein
MQVKEHQIPTAANAVQPAQPKPLNPSSDVKTLPSVSQTSKTNRKRKLKETREEDEIDALFSGIGTKRMRGVAASGEVDEASVNVLDADILKAIKAAPADARRGKK